MAKFEITVHEKAVYSKIVEISDADVSRLLAECGDDEDAFLDCIAQRGEEIFLDEGVTLWDCSIPERTVIAANPENGR